MQIPEERIQSAKVPVEEPRTKTTEVQTIFRESEAQTDPYSPEYSVDPQNIPEVLNIAHYKFGSGLPASMIEMDLIEKMREHKAFQNALPPTSDEACFTLRRRLMEEQEHREWDSREEEIKRVQNERLNLLQSALVERERDLEEKHAERTEEIRLKKTEDKERALAKIQRKRIKVLRKMYKARKGVEINAQRRDIIEEYANFGSTVYAPITRDGLSLDKKANKYEVQPEALSSYQGLKELHDVLAVQKPKVFNTMISVDKVRFQFRKQLSRKDRDHQGALDKAHQYIELASEQQRAEQAANEKNEEEKPTLRAHTPRAHREVNNSERELSKDEYEWEKRDKKMRAIILLQRLLRGRAEQNMMFEGKEKRLDLIAELRATEEWKRHSATQEEHMLIDNYQERIMDGVAEAVQAQVISKTMDTLSKELVRLKQERRIDAMVRLAENERRKREAEESGKRQAEQVLRDRQDVLYGDLMKVHQGSVDSYLQSVIMRTIDNTSSLQAYHEAKLKVSKINDFLDKVEKKANKPEVIIKDLVSSFLIPDVERKKVERDRKLHFATPRTPHSVLISTLFLCF